MQEQVARLLGAFVGLLVASSLRIPFSYSEPVRDHGATGLFPSRIRSRDPSSPGFRASASWSSTTSSTQARQFRGTLASLKKCGARPVAIGTLAVYGGAASELAARHDVLSGPPSNDRMSLTALRAARYPGRWVDKERAPRL